MSTPAFERIRYLADGALARVTLNRPDKRNALDGQTVRELKHALAQAEAEPGIRVLLLRGEGPDFCAGADLAALQQIAQEAGPIDNLQDATALGDLFIQLRRARCIIVAAVQGNAIAGGAGLATACDLILAAENAVFGYPEVNLGFVPAMVMSLLRKAVGEKVALELVVRGDRISAADAARIGLVNRVFPVAHFEAGVEEWVAGLAARSGSALQLTKRLFYGVDNLAVEDAIRRGAEINVLARMTDDCRTGVRQFLERQK